MPASKTRSKTAKKPTQATARKLAAGRSRKPAGIEEYLRGLPPARRSETRAVRKIILGVNPKITEEIKWAAPSFAMGEHFCTFNAWAREGVQLILHHGPRKTASKGAPIQDPHGLLEWLAADRASIRFESMQDIRAKKTALESIVRQWVKTMRTA